MYRIMICDDSAFMRRALKDMLEADSSIELVAVARNGREAIEYAEKYKPDAMTLDIEMPEIDGLTALRTIMRDCPTRVLMLSSLTTEGSDAALKAMRYGAADVMAKDHATVPSNLNEIESELVRRVKALAASPVRVTSRTANQTRESAKTSESTNASSGENESSGRIKDSGYRAILIGSSTGGPPVLEKVLSSITASQGLPIVVAQHMPKLFTESMARRLDEICQVPVVHLDDRLPIRSGVIHIAPGGSNTHLSSCKTGAAAIAKVNMQPESTVYFPSVDVLFESGSRAFGGPVLGVVLTGMGDDGAKGAANIRTAGGSVATQLASTCVVNGMPGATVKLGNSDAQMTPEKIGSLLGRLRGSAAARGAA